MVKSPALRLQAKSIKDFYAFGAHEETEECSRLLLMAASGEDSAGLADGIVKAFGQQGSAAFEQTPGGDDRIGVSAFGVLEGLPDVFAVDDLILDGAPQTGALEGLAGGRAVGSMLGIGDGDVFDFGTAEVFKLLHGSGKRPQPDPAFSVDGDRVRDEVTGADEVVNIEFVGGEENIVGSAAGDLPGEHPAGARDELRVDAGKTMKRRSQIGLYGG